MIGVLIWRWILIIRQVQECDRIPLIDLLNEAYTSPTDNIDKDKFDKWHMTPNQYTFVGFMDGKLVATYTIFIEHKLIHNYGKVAHGEDLAVLEEYRGKGLAKRMMEYGIEFCKQKGVYKLLTTCTEDMVDYYTKNLGTRVHEISLRRDFN